MNNIEIIKKPFYSIRNKLTDIAFYKNFIEQATKEFKKNNSEQQNIINNMKLKDGFVQSSNFTCYSPYDGIIRILGNKSDNISSRIDTIEYQYNKQCQWLLVEAYEEYEKYIKFLYGRIGYIDNSFWQASDFGNISINEIPNKTIEWFEEKVDKKTRNIDNILKQIKKQIPNIETVAKTNELRKPLNLIIIAIEKLRHIIVHNDGKTKYKKQFIEKIIKESGLYNNGNYEEIIFNNLAKFFDDNNNIKLKHIDSQITNNLGISIEVNYDGFNDLLSNLGSYILIIQKEIEKYLVDKNLIEDGST